MEEYSPAGTLSLSLPLNKRLNIKQACLFQSECDTNLFPIVKLEMICKLVPTSFNAKSTLIIFVIQPVKMGSTFYNTLRYLQNSIRDMFPPKSYTLWRFATSYIMFHSSNYDKSSQNIPKKKKLRAIGLNLSGPNLESWSTVINVNITKREIEERLFNFKDRIRLKKHGIGLITAPVVIEEPSDNLCYTDSHELVDDMKKIIPEIPFFGAFCKVDNYYFGINSMSDDESNEPQIIDHSKIISIMIFTYE